MQRVPRVVSALTAIPKRSLQTPATGSGGRSSVSGITATVFGSTGFLGRYVVNRLGKIGSQVIVPYRGEKLNTRHLRVMGDLGQINFFDFDLLNPESVRRLVQHSNVVINLIGQDHNSRHYSVEDVNIHGARIIAQAAKDAGVERLIHVSALNADNESESHFLRSKAQAENVVLDEFPDATIVRPADIFGPEDRFFNKFALLKNVPFIVPVPGSGDQLKQPVYVLDVADGIMSILKDDNSYGKVYEFVGPKKYTMTELLEYTFKAIHRPHRIVPIPAEILKLVGTVIQTIPLTPFVTADEVSRLTKSDELSGAPGLEDLGIKPTLLEQVGLTILRRYRNHLYYDEPLQFDNKGK